MTGVVNGYSIMADDGAICLNWICVLTGTID